MLRAVQGQGVEVEDVGEGGVHGHGPGAVPRAGFGVEDLGGSGGWGGYDGVGDVGGWCGRGGGIRNKPSHQPTTKQHKPLFSHPAYLLTELKFLMGRETNRTNSTAQKSAFFTA